MKLLIGLIFDPIKNEIFYAEKNNGSFLIIKELEFQKNQNWWMFICNK